MSYVAMTTRATGYIVDKEDDWDVLLANLAALRIGQHSAGGATSLESRATGTIYSEEIAVGNVGTGEDTLFTRALAANVLATNNQRIRVEINGSFAANANNKRLRLKFGATTIFDSGAIAPNGLVWSMETIIVRLSATTQRAYTELHIPGFTTPLYGQRATPGETLSGAINIVLTGEATSNSDVVMNENLISFVQG
jgi:hypothetical protein